MQESVRISDGVVVGVDKLLSVLLLHLRGIVWLEESGVAWIAVMVVEVGTIGVEHDEEFLVFLAQYLVEDREQFGIIDVSILVCLHLEGLTSVSLGESLVAISSLDECPLVGLLAKEVDERVVGQLVADEDGMESSLSEGGEDTFLMEEILEIVG